MSLSSRLFGKRSGAAAPAPSSSPPTVTAAQDIAQTIELCEKREQHVQRLVEREVEAARAHAAGGNRKAALECVKRKKIHEKELERLSVQKISLMEQESTLHSLKFNNIVLHSHQRGAEAISREVKLSGGAEGADKVLDRLEDALDDATELLGTSARKMGEAAKLDDEELLEELEQMELADELCGITAGAAGAAGASSASGAAASARTAPVPLAVPRTTAAQVAKRAEEEERELAELVSLQSTMKIEQPMPMPMMANIQQHMPMPMMAF